MNLIRRWREKRERERLGEHRWDALGTYNAERMRGVVHTPEHQAAMSEEQRQFYEEQGYEFWEDQGDGIVGRGPYGRIAIR